MKIRNLIKKVMHLTRRYDVPADHTWAKASVDAKRIEPATEAEIDAVIDRAREFIQTSASPKQTS